MKMQSFLVSILIVKVPLRLGNDILNSLPGSFSA